MTLSLKPLRGQVGTLADPYAGDRLGRKKSVDVLLNLISSVTDPFVLSIEGSWGTGKTTFIKMLSASLTTRGHPTFYFNAWDSDFASDPLIAVMGELDAQFKNVVKSYRAPQAAVKWAKAKEAAANVSSAILPIIVRAGTAGLVGVNDIEALKEAIEKAGDDVAKLSSKVLQEEITRHADHHQSISAFRKRLEELAVALSKAKKPAALPMVIFIDELDRCKPTFAVALLERIKHILNVPGVCFVLAVDRAQLSTSVQLLYGAGTDATGYLRRFIDLEYQLPAASTKEFIGHLVDQVKLGELLQSRKDGNHEYSAVLRLLPGLARVFDLSLRDQERAVLVVELAFRLAGQDFLVPVALLSICAVLKVRRADVYRSYITGGSVDPIVELIGRSEQGKALLQSPEGAEMEIYLRLASKVSTDRSPYTDYASRSWGSDDPGRKVDHQRWVDMGARIMQLMQSPVLQDPQSWMLPQIAKMVDLSEQFERS